MSGHDFPRFLQSSGLAPEMRALALAAHPDDETVGMGVGLSKLQDVFVAHATDGAPRNMTDARAAGFSTGKDYAAARRRELEEAMGFCGIPAERLIGAETADQDASFDLDGLSERLRGIIESLRPKMIFCPAYEGGHPDHDALSFAAHVALHLLHRGKKPCPALFEYALYNAARGRMSVFRFIEDHGGPPAVFELSAEERALKRRMINCFRTQARVLEAFPAGIEAMRPAPVYDFTAPPHPGRLHYENYDWGVNGGTWRNLAAESLGKFDIRGAI